MGHPSEARSRVIICRGARATERRLLAELDALIPASADELMRPLRIVVPSRSLRRHLLRTLARRRRAVVGLEISTLYGLALQIVTRRGQPTPLLDDGFEVLVRRLAGALPALASGLDSLSDGYDAVVGAVGDLLDAGFVPGNEEGVLERLDQVASEVAPERVDRARALVRLASVSFEAADEVGLSRSLRALQLAEEALSLNGQQVLPSRALLVHGFADVTGVAADLLVTLLRVVGGTVLLDRPPDPSRPGREDSGGAYLGRIEDRLAHLHREADPVVDEPPEVMLAEAPDGESEARWVAERVRSLLDEGATAEHIGIVGRTLESAASPLRRHIHRLGIQFSGVGATVPGAGRTRLLQRLMELLERGPSSEVELWLEARAEHARAGELLLGARVLGVARLTDLARLPASAVSRSGVVLPLAVGPDDEVDDLESSRRLPHDVLLAAIREAEDLATLVEHWPARAPAGDHRHRTLALIAALAWPPSSPPARAVHTAVDGLRDEFPEDVELTLDEWRRLLGDRLQAAARQDIGGRGAGVQVLTVMEGRARTFAHLFVLGANRGIFPRLANEDPMLAEAVRTQLAADVLPEMPVKGRSADEERYLFAQLMSSAPQVTVSWRVFGPDGTMTPSPFVDRLRSETGREVLRVPPLWSSGLVAQQRRTAYELAVDAAGGGDPTQLEAPLAAALDEGREDAGVAWMTVSPAAAAAARIDLIRAVERPQHSEAVSPWFGLTGVAGDGADDPLWVTHAEATGTCPWRAFVERRLRVLPMPDPLLGLPGIDGPLVGRVVHEVLEAVAAATVPVGGALASVVARSPSPVCWPDAAAFEELLTAAAERVAAKAGLAPVGMAPLLAARSRELLAVARRLEWKDGPLAAVVGIEVTGEADLEGWAGRLAFRADRADLRDGSLVLVDYKTGKPLSDAKGEDTRRQHLRVKVSRGRVLQAAAYSCAAEAGAARGRYLFLKPDDGWSDEVRVLEVAREDDEVLQAFAAAVETISKTRALGVAFPRVVEADGRPAEHCRSCPVAEACRRDDSGFRRGLVSWMARHDDPRVAEAAAAARELWWLGFERPGEVG